MEILGFDQARQQVTEAYLYNPTDKTLRSHFDGKPVTIGPGDAARFPNKNLAIDYAAMPTYYLLPPGESIDDNDIDVRLPNRGMGKNLLKVMTFAEIEGLSSAPLTAVVASKEGSTFDPNAPSTWTPDGIQTYLADALGSGRLTADSCRAYAAEFFPNDRQNVPEPTNPYSWRQVALRGLLKRSRPGATAPVVVKKATKKATKGKASA